MSASALLPAAAAPDRDRIPVLDIAPYLAGDAGAAAPLARAIARTFEDTGFLVIANHGIPPRLVEDTFAVAHDSSPAPSPRSSRSRSATTISVICRSAAKPCAIRR